MWSLTSVGLAGFAIAFLGVSFPETRPEGCEGLDRSPVSKVFEDEAICQLKMEYTGAFPNPVWVNQDSVCVGSCTDAGDCAPQVISSVTEGGVLVSTVECQCASGGGNGGCVAHQVRTSTDGGLTWASRKLKCEGSSSCPAQTTCTWAVTPNPPGHAFGTWATCKCK